jgi:hypothetical protein
MPACPGHLPDLQFTSAPDTRQDDVPEGTQT